MPLPLRLAAWAVAALPGLDRAECFGPPLPPAATGGCGGPYFDDFVETEHFLVQWDAGTLSGPEVLRLSEALETAWAAEIDALGWAEPAGTGRVRLPVLVLRGEAPGGSTSTERCDDLGIDLPVIVLSDASFDGDPQYIDSLAAHELNHASQLAYGQLHERWFWEATATWMEAQARPELGLWRDRVPAWATRPELGMNAWDRSGDHPEITDRSYGLAVFVHQLSAVEGGPGLVRGLWEDTAGQPGQFTRWLPEALERADLSVDDVLLRFLVAAARDALPMVEGELGLELEAQLDALPAAGTLGAPPQSLGITIIEITDLDVDPDPYLHLRLSPEGPAAERWIGALITDDAAAPVVWDEQGRGLGALRLDGADRAWLALLPLDSEAQGPAYPWATAPGFDLRWALSRSAAAAPEPWPAVEIAPAKDRAAGGCAAAPRTSAVALGLAGAAALLRLGARRRIGPPPG